jgi:hypothetical protein
MLQNAASFSYQKDKNNYDWTNTTAFPDQGSVIQSDLFQHNEITALQAGWNTSVTRRLWKDIFVEPALGLGLENHALLRRQGNATPVRELIDSLSPEIHNDIYSLGPKLSIRQGNKQQQWNISLEARTLWTNPSLQSGAQLRQQYQYLLPALFWRRDLNSDRTVELSYNTSIRVPATNELLPVWYFSSPLSGIRGDIALSPEYNHSIVASYRHFDRFSMSSFFVSINGTYVQHKITTALNITPDLGQRAQWINTDHATNLYLNGSYSRPVKPLKLEINLELNESLQSTQSPVNGVMNSNTSYGHQLGITVGNHKHKDKWNLRIGGNLQVSDVRYSINNEFNNLFSTWTATAFLDWQPHKKWFFAVDGNLKYYTARSFDQSVCIPLISAELTHYILPLERGALTLKLFDLLDQNRSVIRQGFNNRLVEQRSNVLQRYLMLTFTYKLNKIGGAMNG